MFNQSNMPPRYDSQVAIKKGHQIKEQDNHHQEQQHGKLERILFSVLVNKIAFDLQNLKSHLQIPIQSQAYKSRISKTLIKFYTTHNQNGMI
jgi:hypothetical protein